MDCSYIGWNWQVLIKIAGRKRKQNNKSTYAYEARTVQGNCIFLGTFSCAAKTALGAAQEALMNALLKARDMGYQRILVLCNSSRLVQVSNLVRAQNWQEQTMVSDILSLQQNGLLCKLLFVPNMVLSHVCYLADQATKMPIHQFWAPMLSDVNSNSYVILFSILMVSKKKKRRLTKIKTSSISVCFVLNDSKASSL